MRTDRLLIFSALIGLVLVAARLGQRLGLHRRRRRRARVGRPPAAALARRRDRRFDLAEHVVADRLDASVQDATLSLVRRADSVRADRAQIRGQR